MESTVDQCFGIDDFSPQINDKKKGQLLPAMGKDGNNHIYPRAWAFVHVENTES